MDNLKDIRWKQRFENFDKSYKLLNKYANASILSNTVIYDNVDKNSKTIDITIDKINKVLGINISLEAVIEIFKALGFDVQDNKDYLSKKRKTV